MEKILGWTWITKTLNKKESTSQFGTLLKELQTIKKNQTDFVRVQAFKNDKLSTRLARVEVCNPKDRDKRREQDESRLRYRWDEHDNHDRDELP